MSAKATSHSKRLILLQGPVGPAFMRIAEYFESMGWAVTQVAFNAGDVVFSHKRHRLRFSGTQDQWREMFSQLIDLDQETCVMYFGCERPAHKIAAEICQSRGVEAWSFEEGYIRPGFVTVERYGNNARSPLAGQLPDTSLDYPEINKTDYRGAKWMWWYAFVYYNARGLFSKRSDKALYHREVNLIADAYGFVRNWVRYLTRRKANDQLIKEITQKLKGRYFIVPLQVETDLAMRKSSNQCSNTCFIQRVIELFATEANEFHHLVFKIHPLDRGNNARYHAIVKTAARYGVSDRVRIVDTGCLVELTTHAIGMLTINSTSGFSAIYHHKPLLVMGDALYRHPSLAHCASDTSDIDRFWTECQVPEVDGLVYTHWLAERSLIAGDWYSPNARVDLLNNLVSKITETNSAVSKTINAPQLKLVVNE